MTSKKTWHDALDIFKADPGMRPKLSKPFIVGERTYATDTYRAISIKCAYTGHYDTMEENRRIAEVFEEVREYMKEQAVGIVDLLEILEEIQPLKTAKKQERKEIKCKECRGTGTSECPHCYQDMDCEEYLSKSNYYERTFSLQELYAKFNINRNLLLYWNTENDGFPINIIMQWFAFIIAASSWLIRGKRVMWSYTDHIESAIGKSSSSIRIYTPDVWTCLIISDWKHSCLVWYQNEDFVKSLLVIDWLKIKVKEPDYQECIPLTN